MICVVNSQLLAAELRAIRKIVPVKPAVIVLGYVMLQANEDGLGLYATDLEVGLRATCPAQVDLPGRTLLPAARLCAFVEQFTDADVRIGVDKKGVTLECGAFKSKLQTLPTEDFPALPPVEGDACAIDADALRLMIARTRYAVAASGSKSALKGALLTMVGPTAAMVATDAKRLAIATAGRDGPDVHVILPIKTLDMLAGGTEQGDVTMTIGKRHTFFTTQGHLLASRMIEVEFPKYERIIPRDNNLVVTAERDVMRAAFKRVVLASEETQAVSISLAQNAMVLAAASREVGATESIAVQYDGPPMKLVVNGDYVLDFLEAASGKMITMALKDANSAALFMDGQDHMAVVMLMR